MSSGDWGAGASVGSNYGMTGTYFWYGDHSIDTSLTYNLDYAMDRKGAGAAYNNVSLPKVQGGLYACSTTDFLSWKNEGIMVCCSWYLSMLCVQKLLYVALTENSACVLAATRKRVASASSPATPASRVRRLRLRQAFSRMLWSRDSQNSKS